MRAFMVIVAIASLYAVIYYRLTVRYYFEQATGRRESAFGALFSVPPYRALPEKGRRAARRYMVAVLLLISLVVALGLTTELPGPGARRPVAAATP